MKQFQVVLSFILFLLITKEGVAQQNTIKIIDVPGLESLMVQSEGEKLKVINFWATWCKPCVKELPYFVNSQNEFDEVEFIYISIDFAENASKAETFAQKKRLNPAGLYLIDDLDYNSWIDKVSPEWSGAIPATLIMKDGKKYFYEQEFHEGELEELIKQKLN